MHDIPTLIDLISDPELRGKVTEMYRVLRADRVLRAEMKRRPAAVRHHHWWAGGYFEHVQEVMNNVCIIVQGMGHTYDDFEVSLDDALLTAFVHDVDKLVRYEMASRGWPKGQPFIYREGKLACESSGLVVRTCADFGILLNEEQIHAVSLHHGGWSVIFKEQPYAEMSPLATVLHCADLLSAKVRGSRKKIRR